MNQIAISDWEFSSEFSSKLILVYRILWFGGSRWIFEWISLIFKIMKLKLHMTKQITSSKMKIKIFTKLFQNEYLRFGVFEILNST